MEKALLTSVELANLLKVSTRTLIRYRKIGMPYIQNERIVRYEYDKVIEWLKGGEQNDEING